MRFKAVATGLWLALLFSTAAAGSSSSLDIDASATVDVDAEGHAHVVEMGKVTRLSDVASLAPIADQISQRLHDRIESWQFVPASRNGVAVRSRTHLNVSMSASDDGQGGMAVKLVSASTGGAVQTYDRRSLVMALVKAGENAFLVADLHYAADGHVTDVVIRDGRTGSVVKSVRRADRDFQKGLVQALERWTFDPELVDGVPIEGDGRLPMRVCLNSPCHEAEEKADTASDGLRFASADPAVKLRSAVAGTAL